MRAIYAARVVNSMAVRFIGEDTALFGGFWLATSTRALAEKTTPHLDLLFEQTPVLFRDTCFPREPWECVLLHNVP